MSRIRRIAAFVLAVLGLVIGVGFVTASYGSAHTGRPLPADMHWRGVRHQIDDCGRHNAGQLKIIVWRGNGDGSSALFCPDGTVWPS